MSLNKNYPYKLFNRNQARAVNSFYWVTWLIHCECLHCVTGFRHQGKKERKWHDWFKCEWLPCMTWLIHMCLIRLVGSLKSQVSFAKEPYKRDYILQKRLIIGLLSCVHDWLPANSCEVATVSRIDEIMGLLAVPSYQRRPSSPRNREGNVRRSEIPYLRA